MSAGYEAIDPATLRGRPLNQQVLDALAIGAVPGGVDRTYAIDSFELHIHPDLGERLLALAEGLPDARPAGVYGAACLIDGASVIRVVARGTSGLWIRLDGDERAGLLGDGALEAPDFGPDWVRMDAWQTVLPFAEGTAFLRSRVAAAFGIREPEPSEPGTPRPAGAGASPDA